MNASGMNVVLNPCSEQYFSIINSVTLSFCLLIFEGNSKKLFLITLTRYSCFVEVMLQKLANIINYG